MLQEELEQDKIIEKGKVGRHETFTPRYGWLKKGFDQVHNKDGSAFKAKNSIERLGVGKNMVSSIRFWCQAFKIIETNNNGKMKSTSFGCQLLLDNGWDPFLEDIGSLWLLHWQLFLPPLEAVSWALAFNRCNLWSFDIKQLTKVIINSAQCYSRLASLSGNSFERDASCIIRMYTETSFEKDTEIDCPFTQLGLIKKAEADHLVYFDNSEKRNLPSLIFAAACFSYIDKFIPSGQKTVNIQRLSYDFNSPGVVFKVPESSVGSYLAQTAKRLKGFSLINVMGNTQLSFEEEPKDLYKKALELYYEGAEK